MNRVRRVRRSVGVAATVLALVAVGCSGGGGNDARARPATGKPLRYVALGGDDAYGGRRSVATAWPQLLFRDHLAVNATLVNLASPRHGAAEIHRDQVPTAVRLRPDIATITLLDDLERASPPQTVQQDLGAILESLRKVDGIRILVGTAPPDTGTADARRAFDSVITAAAHTQGVEIVDLGRASATDPGVRAREIADAFAQELAKRAPVGIST